MRIFILFIFLYFAQNLNVMASHNNKTKSKKDIAQVKLVKAKKIIFSENLSFAGYLKSVNSRDISSPLTAATKKIFIRSGQQVKKTNSIFGPVSNRWFSI